METKGCQIVKTTLRQKRAGDIMLSNFRLYYKATVITTAWCWHESRFIAQWNRIESLEINPYTYCQLIYGKWDKNIQCRKDSLSINRAGKTGQTHKRMSLEHCFIPCTKIKLTKDLNVRPEILKFGEENIGRILPDITPWHKLYQHIFLVLPPKAKEVNTKIS